MKEQLLKLHFNSRSKTEKALKINGLDDKGTRAVLDARLNELNYTQLLATLKQM